MRFFQQLTFVFSMITTATSALSEGINLTVEGVRNDNGTVIILVFDETNAFENLLTDKAVAFAKIPAKTGTVKTLFPGLDSGPYALFLFHDENGDEDLNTSWFHLLEGVGATGAPSPDDEPSFAQASVGPGDVTVYIHYEE